MNRCYPHPLVAREGWHIIAALAAATIVALLWGSLKTAGVLFSATLIAAYLFRDHVRNIPMQPEAVLSPADGRIASVARARHPQHGGDTLKISIRTPVWRAYAVRSPAEQPLAEHHKTELGYSFPSGHTSFAAAWLMLFVGFTHGWRRNRRAVWRLAVAAWAAGVLASRVLLGAHFPVDLFAACLLVAVWNIVLFWFVLPPLQRVFRLPETINHK